MPVGYDVSGGDWDLSKAQAIRLIGEKHILFLTVQFMHARIHPLCLSLMPVTCYYWLMQ